MAQLVTVQLPIDWSAFGLSPTPQMGNTCLVSGDPAWAWEGDYPQLGVAPVQQLVGEETTGWGLDHVVLLVPDLDDMVRLAQETIGAPRLRTAVEGRPTAFYRVGPLLEVIESPVRAPALFGIALVTDRPLDELAIAWRDQGHRVTDPHPAMQPGRSILTVKGLNAGFAVMSPDGAAG